MASTTIKETTMNYVLIGLPGSGKSTLGVLLAKYLGYSFLDADIVIQESTGKLLREIIEEEGPEGFIEVENKIGCGINVDRTVIATGGSAVLGKEAMEHYRENGKIIYLEMSYDEMLRRVSSDLRKRGVVLREGQTPRDMYEERCKLYTTYADFTIAEEQLNMEETLQKILDCIP